MREISVKLFIKLSSRILCQLAISLAALSLLTSCSVYRSNFTCGEAKGARCRSMDQVDRMIDSGMIEQFNEEQNNIGAGHCLDCNAIGKQRHLSKKGKQVMAKNLFLEQLEETTQGPLDQLNLYFNELETKARIGD